jgi:DNA repair exonuclease SbcCD ATPase subunit
MISVFFLSLYYETTRSETEKALIQDISERQKAEKEKERLITNLEEALAQIKALSGLLPICSSCKRIRDDHGNWNQMESYIQKHSEAQFSHSICPDCAEKIYPELYERS